MRPNNYVTIQGWMRTELNLKGNELLLYAIIYGFSQTENQKFTGSLQYLANWCGATRQGVLKNLNNLIHKDLIKKEERYINNKKVIEYYPIENTASGNLRLQATGNLRLQPGNLRLHNNIDNTLKDNNLLSNKLDNNTFLGSAKPKPRQSLYDKCLAVINDFAQEDDKLRHLLINYLNMSLDMAREQDKPFYSNTFKGKLNKLKDFSKNDWIKIVEQSINNGWLNFYDIKRPTNNFNESINAVNNTFDEKAQEELDDFASKLESEGRQIKF